MKLSNVRYYLWIAPMILGGAIFYSVIFMSLIKKIVDLTDLYLKIAWVLTYLVINIFGFAYYVPRMRKVWLGEAMEEKYASRLASWVGIVIGALTFTIIFIPQIGKIKFLDDAPYYLVVGVAFVVFLCFMIVVGFGLWRRSGR